VLADNIVGAESVRNYWPLEARTLTTSGVASP
jgi:hypothetical protein